MAKRQYGNTAIRQNGNMAKWQYCNMAIRKYSNTAIQQDGEMAKWQNWVISASKSGHFGLEIAQKIHEIIKLELKS